MNHFVRRVLFAVTLPLNETTRKKCIHCVSIIASDRIYALLQPKEINWVSHPIPYRLRVDRSSLDRVGSGVRRAA
jgi:hypothetical protein